LELLSTAFQPPFHRRWRPAKLPGRLLLRLAFQAAQNHHKAVPFREPPDLLINCREQFAASQLVQRVGPRAGLRDPSGLGLPVLPARRTPQRVQCHLPADAVEPGGKSVRGAHACGFPRQNEKSGLEGVLGLVGVAQYPPADAEHHRAVPGNEDCEGAFVLLPNEAAQQLGIARRTHLRTRRQAANVAQ
jgi:hypothetical protein